MFDPDALSFLSPEDLKLVGAIPGLQDKNALLEEQIAQAQALRQPGRQYGTWGGALAGGMGDLLRGIAGTRQENTLRGQQEGNLGQIQAGRDVFNGGLLRMQGAGQAAPYYLRRPLQQQDEFSMMPFMFGR